MPLKLQILKRKKRSLFIYLLGKKGRQIYKTLTIKNAKGETIENDDEKKLEMVIEAFKDYCKPMKTLTVDRVEFLRKEQSKDESFEDYLLNLKSSSKDCEWNNVTENDMIKLQIIKRLHDKKTREILLREPDLTLTQCIDRCRAAEQSKIQSQKIVKYEKLNVDDDTYEKDINATGRKKQYDCIYCQRSHVKGTRNCPAYGQECFRCKRKKPFRHIKNLQR